MPDKKNKFQSKILINIQLSFVSESYTSFRSDRHSARFLTADFSINVVMIELINSSFCYSLVQRFWPGQSSNGRLGASHLLPDSVMIGLVSFLLFRRYSCYK